MGQGSCETLAIAYNAVLIDALNYTVPAIIVRHQSVKV